jgi:hypothetical protein
MTCRMIILIITLNKGFPDKIMVAQLVKKFLTLYGIINAITVVSRIPHSSLSCFR